MRYALVVLVLLSGQAHAADRIPKSMLGKWASDPAACGEQSSELGMTVEPMSVLFYEHSHSVRRISKSRDGSLKVSGYSEDLDGRSRSSITLKLLAADRLRVGQQIYHRCRRIERK
jgi:hypothetical protein